MNKIQYISRLLPQLQYVVQSWLGLRYMQAVHMVLAMYGRTIGLGSPVKNIELEHLNMENTVAFGSKF